MCKYFCIVKKELNETKKKGYIMKTNRLIAVLALAAVLSASPALAQGRGGGSHGGGHSSSSSSRGGGSSHSSSSSSRSSSSFSGSSSRSSSSSSSRSSYSGSRNNSSYSGSRSNSSVSRPSTTERRGSATYRNESPSRSSFRSDNRSSENGSSRNSGSRDSYRGSSRSSVGAPSSNAPSNRAATRSEANTYRPSRGGGAVDRPGDRPGNRNGGNPPSAGNRGTSGRGTVHPQNDPGHTYARPGHPGPMPPSHRHMHPAPYFHHPYHHHMIHMRPVYWHPLPPRPIFWPGFWVYCNSYWYDYHVTDVVVVHKYIHDTYNVDMVSYAISGDLMYAIVNDVDGNTYLQVFDQNDKMLAEQKISRKYIKTEIDRENGGCWIFKKRDKDPMLFLYTNGELLIYEAD